VRDQAPFDEIERAFTGLVVLSDNKKLLARRSIVAGPNVAYPVVTGVEAVDYGEPERTGTLDHTAAHR
jgi:hypothetical protein